LKIVHLINGLFTGGAEMMLARLVERMDRSRFEITVITLLASGRLEPRFEQMGVEVLSLGMRRGVPDPRAIVRCSRLLRRLSPDCVQSWMYHSDLLALLAAQLAGAPQIIWGIRSSGAEGCAAATGPLIQLCALLSRLPDAIVANSEAGRLAHERLGYDARRIVVIPNGFDLEAFRPEAEARRGVRAELGVAADAVLIGLVGRLHPVKDHETFFRAAGRIEKQIPAAQFLLCGTDVVWGNPGISRMLPENGLRRKIHLLGERRDIARLTAALDVATSCSRSEGFPNVIGEAMACGVPCVATDAGDSARIVGDTGIVVPRGDPAALAGGCERLLRLTPEARRALGERARRRVAERFDIGASARRYEELYASLAGSNHA